MSFFIYFLLIFLKFNKGDKSIFEGIENSQIIVLNETNFDNLIQSNLNNKWFVMFYSSWCPHCQKIVPILQELAQNLSTELINYAILDCEENVQLKDRFSIMFYPTFILFHDKYQYEYVEKTFDFHTFRKFILEDYKEIEKEEIPLTPQKWRNLIKYIGKILRRAYDVICVDGNQGFVVIGVLFLLIWLCYIAQGYFSKKLDEYLKQKKLRDQTKKIKKN